MKYDAKKIEKKWQSYWEKEKTYKTPEKGEKFYHLVMFPYPSGELHIGHWYNFVGADAYARKKRMEGYRVMSPFGFDAFGLPAENAAIKREIHPEKWTYGNIERMKAQLKTMGAIYDWDREVVTCDPNYYKWTQWLFLKLFEKGLSYRKKMMANYCPSCNTVLANEQVVDGRCERCDTEVVQKEIDQWLFNIKRYAEKLLTSLNDVDWPERTKMMQKNWIGKSVGAVIDFKIDESDFEIPVFTTRPDTLFGATYLVIAPEHSILSRIKEKIKNIEEVETYVRETNKKTERQRISEVEEKRGVILEGVFAVNPVNNKKIPVFIADYVLLHYGTGSIMAVPAHDKRDFDFAKKHKLEIKRVIESKEELPYEGEGKMINSAEFSGINSREAWEKITEKLKREGVAKNEINYKMRDWIVSRQRYWGAPIPIIYCKNCYKGGEEGRDYSLLNGEKYAIVKVPEKELPVELPYLKDFTPPKEGTSPLERAEKFKKAKCPECGGEAKRETDTLDTFVCSSWYYLRYIDPKNEREFADRKRLEEWMPVDIYIGGAEHSVLHLLYSRFITKALKEMDYFSFDEPFFKLRHQGIILGSDGNKMSKSKGNVVDPTKEIEKHGVDAVRMYLCFMGPFEQGGVWNPQGITGLKRFLEKVWALKDKIGEEENKDIEKEIHKTIKKTTKDIEELRFNTAISALMELVNKIDNLTKRQMEKILIILSCFAPHFAEEVFSVIGGDGLISDREWPEYDKEAIVEKEINLIIQVDGKLKDMVVIDVDMSEEEIKKIATENKKVKKQIEDREVEKIIIIKNKLINIVTKKND